MRDHISPLPNNYEQLIESEKIRYVIKSCCLQYDYHKREKLVIYKCILKNAIINNQPRIRVNLINYLFISYY